MIEGISLKNLNCKYLNLKLFDDMNFSIYKGSFVTMVGNNTYGKSILIKILSGLLKTNNSVFINGVPIERSNSRKNIGVILNFDNDVFFGNTVRDELMFSLTNMLRNYNDMGKSILFYANLLGICGILNRQIEDLSFGEKQLVKLASALICQPEFLFIEDIFSKRVKKILFSLMNYLKKTGITIFLVTNDSDDIVIADNIILVTENDIRLFNNRMDFYNIGKELQNFGVNMPFMIDLSDRLHYYGLVDRIILDMNEMVDYLWE